MVELKESISKVKLVSERASKKSCLQLSIAESSERESEKSS